MTRTIDLNADLGEGYGPWTLGDDSALLGIVTSANIACGFHAGDPDTMARTMALAVANGVGIGAHPGFADRQGFGRRRITLTERELGNLVAYQLGAAQAMAAAAGGKVRHLKLHGALANMASEDEAMARTCYAAALGVAHDIRLVTIAATAQQRAAEALGADWAGEVFADRAYDDDGTLTDRSRPGAVLHDAGAAADRLLAMIEAGAIITGSGKRIPARLDTICVHGDTAEAVAMAAGLRDRLTAAGLTLARL
jgi:UPF0271 protein